MNTQASEFLRTLYHEAGHVVMAISTGRTINLVTADADPDYPDFTGRMEAEIISETYGDNSRAQSISFAAVLLAGPIAEAIKFGDEYSSGSDIRAAKTLVTQPANWERVIAKTEKELRKRWAAVEALVLALIGRGQLTGEEAQEIVVEAIMTNLTELNSPLFGDFEERIEVIDLGERETEEGEYVSWQAHIHGSDNAGYLVIIEAHHETPKTRDKHLRILQGESSGDWVEELARLGPFESLEEARQKGRGWG